MDVMNVIMKILTQVIIKVLKEKEDLFAIIVKKVIYKHFQENVHKILN